MNLFQAIPYSRKPMMMEQLVYILPSQILRNINQYHALSQQIIENTVHGSHRSYMQASHRNCSPNNLYTGFSCRKMYAPVLDICQVSTWYLLTLNLAQLWTAAFPAHTKQYFLSTCCTLK